MGTSPYVCCPAGCQVLYDLFTRAQIGCDWDAVQGSWSIVSNRLKAPASSGALIATTRQAGDLGFQVSVESPDVKAGATYRVIVNYRDQNNYHYGEFEFPTGELTIRLGRRVGGSDSVLLEKTWDGNMVGSPQTLSVCLSEREFVAAQEYAPYQIWLPSGSPITGGYGAGLANFGSTEMEFDNFYFGEHFDTNDDCPKCTCRCDDEVVLPMTLDASVTFNGSLSACGTVNVTLKAIEPDSPDFEEGTWYGKATVTCSCEDPLDPFDIHLVLKCGDCTEPNKRFTLRPYDDNGPALGADATVCEKTAGFDCDPLSIPFEFIEWVEGGWCSGESGDTTDLDVTISAS